MTNPENCRKTDDHPKTRSLMPQGCQNSSNINAKTGTEKMLQIISILFLNCKKMKMIIDAMVFECLEGCVRERKSFQHIIRNDSEIHPKRYQRTMENQSDFFGQKINTFGPWSAQWSRRCSGLKKDGCDLLPKGPTMKTRTTNFGRQLITHAVIIY